MRISFLTLTICLGLALTGCATSDDTSAHRDHPAARQAGREAYRASEEVKHGAKEAERELRDATKDFQDGWREARQDRQDRPPMNADKRR